MALFISWQKLFYTQDAFGWDYAWDYVYNNYYVLQASYSYMWTTAAIL